MVNISLMAIWLKSNADIFANIRCPGLENLFGSLVFMSHEVDSIEPDRSCSAGPKKHIKALKIKLQPESDRKIFRR